MSWLTCHGMSVHTGGPAWHTPAQVPPGADPQRKFGGKRGGGGKRPCCTGRKAKRK